LGEREGGGRVRCWEGGGWVWVVTGGQVLGGESERQLLL